MLTGIEAGQGTKRSQRGAASVHVRLGLENGDWVRLPASLSLSRAVSTSKRRQLPAGDQAIGEAEPGIVPGVLVLRAGVSQPHDRVQGLGLGFDFALFRLGLPDELGLGRSSSLFRNDWSLLGARRDHAADRRIRLVENLSLLDLDVADEEAVPNGERGDIELDMLGDVGREYLDLDFSQRVVENAPEVPNPVGNPDQVHGHR